MESFLSQILSTLLLKSCYKKQEKYVFDFKSKCYKHPQGTYTPLWGVNFLVPQKLFSYFFAPQVSDRLRGATELSPGFLSICLG